MSDTVIVVPCFNEQERLNTEAFLAFVDQQSDMNLLFVNDGSDDETLALLAKMEQQRPGRISVLDQPENRGKAEAVRQGVLAAANHDCKFIAYLDADLATPLNAMPEFRSLLEEQKTVELVMGSRVSLLGRQIERKQTRQLLGRAFARAASWVLRLPVYDTQCGAKMFRATETMHDVFSTPFLSKWIFDVEIFARMTQQESLEIETALYESPLQSWRDVAGSKLRPMHFVKAAFELWTIHRQYKSRRREKVSSVSRPQILPGSSRVNPADVTATTSSKKAA